MNDCVKTDYLLIIQRQSFYFLIKLQKRVKTLLRKLFCDLAECKHLISRCGIK